MEWLLFFIIPLAFFGAFCVLLGVDMFRHPEDFDTTDRPLPQYGGHRGRAHSADSTPPVTPRYGAHSPQNTTPVVPRPWGPDEPAGGR